MRDRVERDATRDAAKGRLSASRAFAQDDTISGAAREQNAQFQFDTTRFKIRRQISQSLTLLRRDFATFTTLAETRPARSRQSREERYRANPPLESIHYSRRNAP